MKIISQSTTITAIGTDSQLDEVMTTVNAYNNRARDVMLDRGRDSRTKWPTINSLTNNLTMFTDLVTISNSSLACEIILHTMNIHDTRVVKDIILRTTATEYPRAENGKGRPPKARE